MFKDIINLTKWGVIALIAFEVMAMFTVGAIFVPKLHDYLADKPAPAYSTPSSVKEDDGCVIIIGNNGSEKIC